MQIKVKQNADGKANKMFIAQLENDMLQIKEGKMPYFNMTEDNKSYPLKMRMIIYGMLLANVPTGNIRFLISKIGQYLGVNFTDIPHRSTIEQMARELGCIAELLSGPWMTKFYVSADDASFDHVTGIQVVKDVLKEVTKCKSDPAALFCREIDFFGTTLAPDILQSITTLCPIDDELLKMTSACLNAVDEVLTRQYKRYFSLSITAALKKETASARLHNIDSEELMGMFSDAKGRCPNATICYISSKLRSKKNRTIDYLDNLDELSREKVVKWSICIAGKKRMKTRLLHNEIRAEITGRLGCKRQKMDEKQKRKLERELCILTTSEMMHKYKHLSAKQLEDLDDVMSERIVGRKLGHEWYDADNSKSVIYDGRVEKVKMRLQERIYTISYWKKDETDMEAVEYMMKKIQLAADVITGELIFS
nr:uncharacterized protein LOC124813491 isoform X2 [Hydra vulgaris]